MLPTPHAILCLILMGTWTGASAASAANASTNNKKLIQWGWGEPDTQFIRENISAMQQRPFDGVIFHVTAKPGGNFSWKIWGRRKFHAANVEHAIENLNAVQSETLTDFFLRANVTPGDVSWFDDAAWSVVQNNFGLAARIAKNSGCQGLMFDAEQYDAQLFDYRELRKSDDRPFEQYQAKVRERGRQWITEINRHYPDITILMTLGYAYAQPQGVASRRSETGYGLLADFLDGVLEACSPETNIVDAWEKSYPFKFAEQFELSYERIKNTSLNWTAVPHKYRRHVAAGFGIWMDCYSDELGWHTEGFQRNYFTPEEFRNAVESALAVSDRYVWIYTQEPRWWTDQRLPDEYINALRSARTARIPAAKLPRTQREVKDDDDDKELETSVVKSSVELTAPEVKTQEDLCVWLHPDDPARSTVVTSDADAERVFVYDLKGNVLQEVHVPKPGNVDLRSNVTLDSRTVDVVAVTQREEGSTLRVYRVDPRTRRLRRIDEDIRIQSDTGGCLYHSPEDGRLYFICTSRWGRVEQYELEGVGDGKVRGELVRELRLDQCEAAVTDDQRKLTFIASDKTGVWKLGAEPDDSSPPELIARVWENGLEGDVEGITLVRAADGDGLLVVSDEGSSRFFSYQVKPPHDCVARFAIKGVRGPEGIEVVTKSLGARFPQGLFACCNRADGSVRLTPWSTIVTVLPGPFSLHTEK